MRILENWATFNFKNFNGVYKQNINDKYIYIGQDIINVNDINDSELLNIPKSLIENYITLDTIKKMFLVYNKINFVDDWTTKLHLYKNYLFIYISGYYYTFKKI